MENVYDYIVIGSGFGGSVSSMRLAEKGYSVLTIEKGRHFSCEDFPKSNWNLRKYLWMPTLGFMGFQKLNYFRHAFILSGAGVGGGSLVYGNTLMVPPPEFFNNSQWGHFRQWQSELQPHYEEAGRMLGRTPFNQQNIEDRYLKEVADEMGKGDTFGSVPVAVYFNDDQTPADPYFNGEGPLRSPCKLCAGCMVGCRENAKNTLDKNYLWFAQKMGSDILARREVFKIERKNNEYLVYTRRTGAILFPSVRVYKSRGLVVSAGVLGTMKLLLAQKWHYKTLPDLSDRLGESIRTNSESLCVATLAREKMNNGVAISSVFKPTDDTFVEIVKYPDGSGSLGLLATLATDKKGSPSLRILHYFGAIVKHPVTFLRMTFNRRWAEHSIIFLVMQTVDTHMKFVLRKWPFHNSLTLINKGNEKVQAYIPAGQEVMHRYAAKIGAVAQNSATEILFNTPSTAHILGGAPMGLTVREGVIDPEFRVHGYPNLYILDGSVVQGNLGVNPSFTITAQAEYAMSKIPRKERVAD